ncbi:pseudouridylate synthase 1 homolog [Corticium candelabrum]|uniref:pseudouridylate synthase 1 homolog n=1 Tax=Corticium candelabrum TaxID=121492 RepID=UPI002E270F7A|nr:pseudouridylate synthase 1 homolog [Corticium candelabrum]
MRLIVSLSRVCCWLRRCNPFYRLSMTEEAVEQAADESAREIRCPTAKRAKFDKDETQETTNKEKRRKVALFLSYIGSGYNGMQKNPGVRSIEEDLIVALSKAGTITDECREKLDKMNFQRCARTDKGVSAAVNVVSLKMLVKENALDLINSQLPAQIRVMGLIQTTKKFDCKHWCSSRSYEYLSPTFAFAPSYEKTRRDFRISDEILSRVRYLLYKYNGTHRFHNFTARIRPSDPSAQRYIKEFNCGQPFERQGMEFVVLRVNGQSFMLHQIRKMIGLVMTIAQGHSEEDIIQRAWGGDRVDVPRAPALGLLLDRPYFDAYNKKYGTDGCHECVNVSRFESNIEEFKQKIYDRIIETELKENSMMHWLMTLSRHDFSGDRNETARETKRKMQGSEMVKEQNDHEVMASNSKKSATGRDTGSNSVSVGDGMPLACNIEQ